MKLPLQSLMCCLLVVLALLLSACTQAQDQQDGISVAVCSVNCNADRGVTFILYDVSEAPNPKYKADPYVELQIDGYYPTGGGNLMALAGLVVGENIVLICPNSGGRGLNTLCCGEKDQQI